MGISFLSRRVRGLAEAVVLKARLGVPKGEAEVGCGPPPCFSQNQHHISQFEDCGC